MQITRSILGSIGPGRLVVRRSRCDAIARVTSAVPDTTMTPQFCGSSSREGYHVPALPRTSSRRILVHDLPHLCGRPTPSAHVLNTDVGNVDCTPVVACSRLPTATTTVRRSWTKAQAARAVATHVATLIQVSSTTAAGPSKEPRASSWLAGLPAAALHTQRLLDVLASPAESDTVVLPVPQLPSPQLSKWSHSQPKLEAPHSSKSVHDKGPLEVVRRLLTATFPTPYTLLRTTMHALRREAVPRCVANVKDAWDEATLVEPLHATCTSSANRMWRPARRTPYRPLVYFDPTTGDTREGALPTVMSPQLQASLGSWGPRSEAASTWSTRRVRVVVSNALLPVLGLPQLLSHDYNIDRTERDLEPPISAVLDDATALVYVCGDQVQSARFVVLHTVNLKHTTALYRSYVLSTRRVTLCHNCHCPARGFVVFGS